MILSDNSHVVDLYSQVIAHKRLALLISIQIEVRDYVQKAGADDRRGRRYNGVLLLGGFGGRMPRSPSAWLERGDFFASGLAACPS